MANFEDRVPENQKGLYFVDNSCIDCDTCRCVSPKHFQRNTDGGYSYVAEQPSTPAEVELVEEAMDCCPVSAIGRSPD